MKRSTVFILLLLANVLPSVACIDYPDQDRVRFSIFNPGAFGFRDYRDFFYSAHYLYPGGFYPGEDTAGIDPGKRMNIALWQKRCSEVVPDTAIYEAVYGNSVATTNLFLLALHRHNDTLAINYLEFARTCSGLNDLVADPWERKENSLALLRNDCIHYALEKAENIRDNDIRLRYAFLAIRMSFYNGDYDAIKTCYSKFFADRSEKKLFDYWAMYFRGMVEAQGPVRNYFLAQVFAHAPDKRFMAYMNYDKTVPISKTMYETKNREERAAVWLLEGVHHTGRALTYMQKINAIMPDYEGLDLLLLREMNKLEDWIYTPEYTNFEPSVEVAGMDAYNTGAKMKRRVAADRAYAKQVLEFVRRKKGSTRTMLWKTAQAYLQCMTKDWSSGLSTINKAEAGCTDPVMLEQIGMIKAVCLIGVQDSGNAIIPREIEPLLLRQYKNFNQRFLLAIAKELEFRGNATDAALLMMKINPDGTEWEKEFYWMTHDKRRPFYLEFFSDYFFYLDEAYSTAQMEHLVDAIEKDHSSNTFDGWKYSTGKKQLPRLYDLLGAKYMRLDQLVKALHAFEKVNDTLWSSEYYPYHTYLDANPFYTNFYNEHTKTKADTIRFDKDGITHALIQYIALAEDSTTKHRDYYYFLVANCYFNMTHYGNSWIMTRYCSSSYGEGNIWPGNVNHYQCSRAKSFYLKAKSMAKNKKFAALCLRMVGRCESYRLRDTHSGPDDYCWTLSVEQWNEITNANRYYRQLKKEYPGDYDELISNCYSFDRYFEAWK